jgi:CheY-like chemotaxis protein
MNDSEPRYREVTLLLVEDDEVDAIAVERALRQQRIINPLVRARHGLEALDLLRKPGAVPRPFLILLDLNLPLMNGIEFLAAVRSDPDLNDAVIFVLTTSNADQDKASAYAQHVAGYIVKRNVSDGFLNMVGMLDRYWRVVELPITPPGRGTP